MIYERSGQLEFLNLETSLATLENGDSYLTNLVPSNGKMCLLSSNTAVIATSNFFYKFDSHSDHEIGLNVLNESPVLLKFRYFFEVKDTYRQHVQKKGINAVSNTIFKVKHRANRCAIYSKISGRIHYESNSKVTNERNMLKWVVHRNLIE